MQILETNRLILRHATLGDALFFVELLNDPSWLKFIGDRGVRTTEDAEVYLQKKVIPDYGLLGFGMYVVVLKEKNIPIGTCGLLKRDILENVDIGFAFLSDYTESGFGYESAEAVLKYARKKIGLKKIAAITDEENVRSIGLLKKLGFRYERTFAFDGGSDMVELYATE